MKKLIAGAVVLVVCVLGLPLFAQQISPEHTSEYYYENVTLEKVYPTRMGYILQYRKGGNAMGRMYIPNEWFTDAGSKAELITLDKGVDWPSVTVFYKSGEFSHVRLYVHRLRSHQTWGNVPLNVDLAPYFENVQTVKIEY